MTLHLRTPNGFARPTPTDHPSSLPDMFERHCYFPNLHRQRRIRHGWRISAGVRCWAIPLTAMGTRYGRLTPGLETGAAGH